jgi:signal transduction histidine kinase
VRYGASDLQIEITDTGRGANGSSSGTNGAGHGLRGMRERAAAADGTVEIGSGPAGGFRVAARFPLTAHAPTTPSPHQEADR